MYKLMLCAAVLSGCSAAGVGEVGPEPLPQMPPVETRLVLEGDNNTRIIKNSLATPTPCPTEDVEVWFISGQSNAAGSAQPPGVDGGHVYQHFEGRCYTPVQPLLGASSAGLDAPHHNPFLSVAQAYSVATGKQVVIHLLALGGQGIERWTTDLAPILAAEVQDVQRYRRVDRFLWQQGETDALNGKSEEQYLMRFEQVIGTLRAAGFMGSVHVAQSSRCYNLEKDNPIGAAHRNLQARGYSGPNTDELGAAYRYDGCHFNSHGVREMTRRWLVALCPAFA